MSIRYRIRLDDLSEGQGIQAILPECYDLSFKLQGNAVVVEARDPCDKIINKMVIKLEKRAIPLQREDEGSDGLVCGKKGTERNRR